MVACFEAVRLFIFVIILWTLQPHFTLWLSARTLQCLFVRSVHCIAVFEGVHVTMHSYFTWPWPV